MRAIWWERQKKRKIKKKETSDTVLFVSWTIHFNLGLFFSRVWYISRVTKENFSQLLKWNVIIHKIERKKNPVLLITSPWFLKCKTRCLFFSILGKFFFFWIVCFFYKHLTEDARARALSLVHCIKRKREKGTKKRKERGREKKIRTYSFFLSVIIIWLFNYIRGSRKKNKREREKA